LQSKIKHARVVFPDRRQFKINYSDELVEIVGLLLKKDRRERLGAKNGMKEILAHKWFAGVDIAKLEAQTCTPPFIPDFSDKTKYYEADQSLEAMSNTKLTPSQNQ